MRAIPLRVLLLMGVAGGLAGSAVAATDTADSSAVASGWRGPKSLAVAVDTLRVGPGQTRVDLARPPVVEMLALESEGRTLSEGVDYTLLPAPGVIVLAEAADTWRRLVARYRYDPFQLTSFVPLREEMRVLADSTDGRTPSSVRAPIRDEDEDQRGTVPGLLRIDGSKTVSVQGGTNRDATVDQGLNLSIQGRLTDSIGVRAEISDENLPITPEGNTEELRDLDQVSIELFGPRGRARLGDFRVDEPLGAFVPFRRKLQGLDLQLRDPLGTARVIGGSPQGQRREIEIRGREGVQGPYELLEGNRLDQSFIVAGSERVWVDGELLVRGEVNDYTIDYIRGTLTFTPRVPIDPDRRIAIDFEVSASGYRRNVAGVELDSVTVGPFRLGLSLLREGDDADRPRDRSLEEEEIEALAAAGDDPEEARSSGIRPTAPGEGDYVERFTQDGVRFFAVADSSGGDFDLDFVFVGVGAGSYELVGATATGILEFRFVGAGNGDYVIGRALPLPTVTDVWVAKLALGDSIRGSVRAELDYTVHDGNRLSELDDDDNEGAAWRIEGLSPWWGSDALGLRLRGRAERIEERFQALGRLRVPFFYERWNLQDEVRRSDETHVDLAAELRGRDRSAQVAWQSLGRGDAYDGQRWSSRGEGRLLGPLRWRHAVAATRAERTGGRDSRRDDRRLRLQWSDTGFVPFVERDEEIFEDRREERSTGYRRNGWTFGVEAGARARVSWRREEADSLRSVDGAWTFAREVDTARARGSVGGEHLRVDLDATWRRAHLPNDLTETTRLAQSTLVLRAPSQGLQFDLGYRLGNDQSRVLGRQVVFVGFDEGDYDIEGNPVGVGQGDYDVIFTPSDSLVSSTEVQLDLRLDLQPSSDWLGGWGNTLLWQVTERSRTDEVGRLLRLDPGVLRDPDTTVFGEQRLREELSLLRTVRGFDLRLGHERRDALDQRYTQGPERAMRIRSDARLDAELPGRFSVRLDGAVESRERTTSNEINPLLQGYEVGDRTAALTLRWRPGRTLRAELETRATGRREKRSGLEQTVLAVAPSVDVSLLGVRWTVQGRIADVEEGAGEEADRPFFFERPGLQRGLNTLVQWGGAGSFTVSLRYQLRDEADRPVRHDLGVETRARF